MNARFACGVLSAVLAAGCQGADRAAEAPPAARTVTFEQAVALDDSAATTANASLGDLDADGDLDIVLARGRHWPLVDHVLMNDGAGGFAVRHAVGDSADRSYTAALADLDGDGDLDLVVGNDRPDEKRIHFNDGSGTFRPAGTFGAAAWATRNVTVADLDGDGRSDIVVANRGGPENRSANYICLNDGNGAFPACGVLSSESATTIAAADLDGDGSIDLVVPHRDRGQSRVFLNDGRGGLGDGLSVGPPDAATRAVALGDVTGDGRPDLVMGDEARGGALLYVNRGAGTFAEAIAIGAAADNPYAIAIADVNGDGSLDIVLGNQETPGAILVNRGDGTRFDVSRFGDGAGAVYGLAIGDVTGDACPDIVAARSDARRMLYIGSCSRPSGR